MNAPIPDQADRDAAIRERERNVLIDAGAGTGKTTILVDRLVEMVAPTCGREPVPISRVAAVTFTRKAAGELRFRIREKLLSALADPDVGSGRQTALHDALTGLDTASVGTIHSFADRLLRQRPVEARLGPSYEIAEDSDALVRETWEILMQASQNGTLAAELAGTGAEDRAAEAETTVNDAIRFGIRARHREPEFKIFGGLDSLVEGFVRQRDVPPVDPESAPFDLDSFRRTADEYIERVRPITGDAPGQRWMRRRARLLEELRDEGRPGFLYREVVRYFARYRGDSNKGTGFGGDASSWAAWKAFDGDPRKSPVRATPLRDDLLHPLYRWMAVRLVRLYPVVLALYRKVKARHRAVDQVDLLLELRNLLARDREARAALQGAFEHIFVDEFQDTDPLQAEILVYLCEKGTEAEHWESARLVDGKLTLVGDPKQSIYRFRRADIAMYDRVRSLVSRGAPLHVSLTTNFRSRPALIAHFNDRFEGILGRQEDPETPFDPSTGEVFHQPLDAGRRSDDGGTPGPSVHVVPFGLTDSKKADDYRELEGRVLARYLRWLIERSGVVVEDPVTRNERPVRFGDVAVLAVTTMHLRLLFGELDSMGVPYSARGGTLFLADPLHQQFLLGLRAIADREDGIAEAALLRPPFFAIDLLDLVRERAFRGSDEPDARALHARSARDWVRQLRRRRFERSPGETGRDLLEGSAFARTVALGPNGAQRLKNLREICLVLDQMAASEGLDYDAATARIRHWVSDPVQLDPPHPVGTDAVQVVTVHQAKGLEFPVVVLWDGRGLWKAFVRYPHWHAGRNGEGWAIELDGLTWQEPRGADLLQSERVFHDAERRRVVYVAATRARDLLVIPKAGVPIDGKHIHASLLPSGPGSTDGADGEEATGAAGAASPALFLEEFREGEGAPWAKGIDSPSERPVDISDEDRAVAVRWAEARLEAGKPLFVPTPVSGGRSLLSEEDEVVPFPVPRREGRYGPLFGDTVHRAIGYALSNGEVDPRASVLRAARETGLETLHDEATEDVGRALRALAGEGLVRKPDSTLRLEYPVAGPAAGGKLLVGYIDLVAVSDDTLTILDFKTDQPPAGPVTETHPEYVRQVQLYGTLLESPGLIRGRTLRCGLLFTSDGRIAWAGT